MAMNDGWLFDPTGTTGDGGGPAGGGRGRDYEGGGVADYTPQGAVPMLTQQQLTTMASENPWLKGMTPQQYYNQLYGGGSIVQSTNPTQDAASYFAPTSGNINQTVGQQANWNPADTSFLGMPGWAAPLAVLGVGALAGGLGGGAAAGGATDGFAAGADLSGAGAAGGGAGIGGGALGALTPGPGTLSALGGAGSGGGMAVDPLAWTGADAGNIGAAGSLADTAGLGLAGGGSTLGSLGTLGTLSSLGQGALGALGSISAANTQANAAQNATNAQLGMFNTINQQQAPWRQAGQAALGDIASQQPFFQHQFNAQDLNANLAPNYQFMLDQGLTATKNAANLQSGLVSGNTLKGINDYAQNYAGNAYQNAFNNYTANQNNIFNRLSTIAGLGNAANASVAGAGSSISPGVANTMVGQGAAQASGTIGATNAVNSGIGNAMGWYSLGNLLNA